MACGSVSAELLQWKRRAEQAVGKLLEGEGPSAAARGSSSREWARAQQLQWQAEAGSGGAEGLKGSLRAVSDLALNN